VQETVLQKTRVPEAWEYLQPGDELKVRLLEADEDPIDAPIDPTGHITLPLVGEIKAAGHTLYELKEIIRQAYVPDIYAEGTFNAWLVNVYYFQSPGLPCDCSDDPWESIPLKTGRFPLRKPRSVADVLRDSGLDFTEPRWDLLMYYVWRNPDEAYMLNGPNLETFLLQNGDRIQIPHSMVTF